MSTEVPLNILGAKLRINLFGERTLIFTVADEDGQRAEVRLPVAPTDGYRKLPAEVQPEQGAA